MLRRILVPALSATLIAGCGADEDEPSDRPPAADRHGGQVTSDRHAGSGPATASSGPASASEPGPPAPDEAIGDRPGGPRDQAAVRTVRAYVAALDRRDGGAVCRLIAAGALRRVRLPVKRTTCARSVSASIGYRNPRGSPQWLGARIVGPPAIARRSYGARVVVPLRTRFADRSYVSREDDVVYLNARGAGWVIAKPSAVFFRAIGRADIPPTVLAPPR